MAAVLVQELSSSHSGLNQGEPSVPLDLVMYLSCGLESLPVMLQVKPPPG